MTGPRFEDGGWHWRLARQCSVILRFAVRGAGLHYDGAEEVRMGQPRRKQTLARYLGAIILVLGGVLMLGGIAMLIWG